MLPKSGPHFEGLVFLNHQNHAIMIFYQDQNKSKSPNRRMLLSDSGMVNESRSSDIWKNLFFKPKEAMWSLFLVFLKVHTALLSYAQTSVLRTDHGALTGGGVIQALMIILWGTAYNSELVWPVFSSFSGWVITPFYVWFQTPNELFDLFWLSIKSKAMAIYLIIFTLSAMVNVALNWMGNSHRVSVTSRGIGYSTMLVQYLIGDRFIVSAFAVDLIESITIFSIGVYLFIDGIDPYFGFWMMAMSFSEIQLLLIERAAEINQRRLIDA